MFLLPKDNLRKLIILFKAAEEQIDIHRARNLTTKFLVREILLNNLRNFKVLIPNYLNLYSYKDEVSEILFDHLGQIFEHISAVLPNSKYSILRHLENQCSEQKKKKQEI